MRRFAGIFEFDRNGPPLSGTHEQQQAIRRVLREVAPFGTPLQQTLHKIDQTINQTGRRFVPISFVDFTSQGLLGFTFPTVMQLHYELLPDWIGGVFLHELGHLAGWHAITPKDSGCHWADRFAAWTADQRTDDPVWERITESWGG